jgi:hypothetical protein
MQGGAMVANSAAMTALVDEAGVHIIVAQLFVTAILTCCVYFVSQVWVYR